jgi:hypothetical protein
MAYRQTKPVTVLGILILLVAAAFVAPRSITRVTAPQKTDIAAELRACLPKSDTGSRETCRRLLAGITDYQECVAAGFSVLDSYPPRCATPDGRTFTDTRQRRELILDGRLTCLPHKKGPAITLECASGIKTDDGSYYAVDTTDVSKAMTAVTSADRIRVTGLFVAVEELNTNTWDAYAIKGILKATAVTVLGN